MCIWLLCDLGCGVILVNVGRVVMIRIVERSWEVRSRWGRVSFILIGLI